MDAPAFRALYADLHREIHAYASRRVPSDVADDVVAETFTTVWRRRLAVPDDREELRRWVFGTARKHLAEAQRARARQLGLDRRIALSAVAGIPVVEPDVAEHVVVSMDAFAAFRALSPHDQEVIQLVAWDGLSAEDAAVVLGCSLPAYSARLRRARRRLTAALRRYGLPVTEIVGTERDAMEGGEPDGATAW